MWAGNGGNWPTRVKACSVALRNESCHPPLRPRLVHPKAQPFSFPSPAGLTVHPRVAERLRETERRSASRPAPLTSWVAGSMLSGKHLNPDSHGEAEGQMPPGTQPIPFIQLLNPWPASVGAGQLKMPLASTARGDKGVIRLQRREDSPAGGPTGRFTAPWRHEAASPAPKPRPDAAGGRPPGGRGQLRKRAK